MIKGATRGEAKGAEAPSLNQVKVKNKDKIPDSLIFYLFCILVILIYVIWPNLWS